MAVVVDEGDVLAVGVDDRAQVGAGGPHQLRDLGGVLPAVEGQRLAGRGVGVDRQHLGAELGQHVGHHEAGRPVGVVEHDLEAGGPDGVDVDVLHQHGGVVLGGADGKAKSPISPARDRRKSSR